MNEVKKEENEDEEINDEEVNQEDEKIIQEIMVQVEMKHKKSKFTGNKIITSILKLIIGLYLVGVVVGVNEILTMQIGPLLDIIHSSKFMTAELLPWANILFGPVRFMASLLSWFTPVIMLNVILFFILSKIKWITKKELKIFLYIMTVALLLVF